MKVYIASRFTPNRQTVIKMACKLSTIGIECTQTWPLEPQDCNQTDVAKKDLKELNSADAIILYTHNCDQTPGGMHFEAGYAVARHKKFFLIGPCVNIFCYLADEKFNTFDDFFLRMDAATYTREGGRWTW